MTQVSDTARDLVTNVVEHATEYATTVADEARTVATDAAQQAKRRMQHGQDDAGRKHRSNSRAMRTVMFVVGAAVVAVVVARLVQRRRVDDRPPVTHLGPEAGTPSSVPGPAFDPEGSPMRAEASGVSPTNS